MFVKLYKKKHEKIEDLFTSYKTLNFPAQKTCLPFSRELFLSVTGDIFPCETIPRTHPIGKISENGYVDFSLKKIAETYNKLFSFQSRYCDLCYMNSYCQNCLFQIISATLKYKKCPEYADINRFKIYIKRYIDYFELHKFEYLYFCLNK